MDDFFRINDILSQKTDVDNKRIINKSYKVKGLSLIMVRDVLIKIGKIEYEDLNRNMYFALVPGGFFKKNTAYIVVELKDDILNLAVFSNEGLINQHTSEDAINEIEEGIRGYICRG